MVMDIVYVAVIIIFIIVQDGLAASCPAQCSCTNSRADCLKRNLTFVPYAFLLNYIEIDLSSNKLTSIKRGAFAGLTKPEVLWLGANQITSIDNGSFKDLQNLRQLHLNFNQLVCIETGRFTGLKNLDTLLLGTNQITSIDNGSFEDLQNLRQLYLDNNWLTSINDGTFTGLANLHTLHLHNNMLKLIEGGAFAVLETLKTLTLSKNNLQCDCHLLSFRIWLLSKHLANGVYCNNGTAIVDLNMKKDLQCTFTEALITKRTCTGTTQVPITAESKTAKTELLISTENRTAECISDVKIKSIIACVNSTVDIVCEAKAISMTGHIAFEWKLNGSKIRPMQTSRMKTFFENMSNDMYRSTLRIHDIKESDAGIIECTVVLGKNLNRSHWSEIQPYILTIQSESLAVQNGGNTSVLCGVSPISESEIQSIVMFRDDKMISISQRTYLHSSVAVHLTNITRATRIECKWMNQTKSADILVFDPEMLECPVEHSNDIMWNNTYPGLSNIQSCPHGFKGLASRYCNIEGKKGKWQKPNMSNCIRTSLLSVLQRVKQIHDGVAVDELGRLLNEFANATKAVTLANKTVVTDLRSSIDILTTVSIMLSERGENVTTDEIEEVFSAIDSIMDINTKDAWKEFHEQTGENNAATILSIVSNISDLILKTLPQNGSVDFVSENLAVQIKRRTIEQITYPDNNVLNFSSHATLSKSTIINSFNVTETVDYTAAYFRTISKFLHSNSKRLVKNVGSDVISFSVNSDKFAKKLSPPLKLFFKTIQTHYSTAECSYWDFNLPYGGNWATDGCEKVFSNENYVECRCDHMTSFAVLLGLIDISDEHHRVLTTIFITGCTVSIVCLVLTIVCYVIVWKDLYYKRYRSMSSDKEVILVLLCISLICAYLTFMLGIDRTQNKVICTAVAVLLHFLFLTVLCLMASEGIIYAYLSTKVFNTQSIKKCLIPLSFVIPVVIVSIFGVATGLHGYETEKVCWLSVDRGLIYAFFVPCILVVSINWIIAGLILRIINSIRANKDRTMTHKLKIGIRSLFIMAPTFGLTWLFGLFSFSEHSIVFSYLFVIFNSLQGAAVFKVHVVQNDHVRNTLKRMVSRLRERKERNTLMSMVSRSRQRKDYITESTDESNTRNILKGTKNDSATFSFDDWSTDYNDVPLDVIQCGEIR